jgi:hypothetical protein
MFTRVILHMIVNVPKLVFYSPSTSSLEIRRAAYTRERWRFRRARWVGRRRPSTPHSALRATVSSTRVSAIGSAQRLAVPMAPTLPWPAWAQPRRAHSLLSSRAPTSECMRAHGLAPTRHLKVSGSTAPRASPRTSPCPGRAGVQTTNLASKTACSSLGERNLIASGPISRALRRDRASVSMVRPRLLHTAQQSTPTHTCGHSSPGRRSSSVPSFQHCGSSQPSSTSAARKSFLAAAAARAQLSPRPPAPAPICLPSSRHRLLGLPRRRGQRNLFARA